MAKKGKKKLNPESLKRKAMFEASRKEYPVCLYPVDRTGAASCPEPAIKAHSIQKSGKLAEIVEGEHVYAFDLKPQFDDPPKLPNLRLTGHNVVTTFLGLCKDHDNGLFEKIDNSPINLADEEHLFLLTYRTVLKEYHEALTLERWTAEAYAEMAGGGAVDPKDTVSRELKEVAARNVGSLRDQKRKMDLLYLDEDFERIKSVVVWLPDADPALAVSAYFSIGAPTTGARKGVETFCALNVFPQNGRHVMVFSFPDGGVLMAKHTLLRELRRLDRRHREQPASRLVLENCEDPVFRPGAYDSFSEKQKDAIRGYYFRTAMLEHAGASPQFDAELRSRLAAGVAKATTVREDDPRINLFRVVA
ncbi:MAG: hypothetical protein AVDCRST_MAG22-847 [uncultured Rubrobacteraceae bacterium]|uniref:Uncharacterized protein n=1 Tax=uncultured Rubrobacteraceae bacterium TaxID=349277 RepID=A0A6J4NRE9_9ACTN|nr:MAG: hypothetical protein AVDCRST_MAG22-847 [uncultured Rubrobacteraceae bacterium]